MPEHKITFLSQNKSGFFEHGTTLRDAALELGILIESSCAGIGTCAKCKVVVKAGGSPLTEAEKQLLSRRELEKGVRLACRAEIAEECLCMVPDTSLPFAQENRIQVSGVDILSELQPEVRALPVPIKHPTLGKKYFYFDQLLDALRSSGVEVQDSDPQAIRDLPNVLSHHEQLYAVVCGKRLAAFCQDQPELYGVAVDVGTTTVAAKLLNLRTGEVLSVNSAINAQTAHGADVVGRIYYCERHPVGTRRLHQLLIKQLNAMLENLTAQADIRLEDVYQMVIDGNTVMQHLALNVNPAKLGTSPFAPILQGPVSLSARELDIRIHPAGSIEIMPNLGGYVGSDITAVLTVLEIDCSDDLQVVVDLGTNGEVVVGNKDRMLCCSSPAGPAWEGACISWGMRAANGAIERAEMIDGELQIKTVGSKPPIGICGSGLLDLVSEFYRAGLIQASGRILPPDMLSEKVLDALKNRVQKSDNGPFEIRIAQVYDERWITLTQADVRELQLAKAAIASGIDLLLKELDRKPSDIAEVYIAGAFGNHVRSQDVLDLGMLPMVEQERIHFIGNAALTGAEAVLRSKAAREKAARLARSVDYIEISGRSDFQDAFVEAIAFRQLAEK